ncbi:hypothetical protein Tco_0542189 [Tanacetum coccineum]
MRAMNSLNSIGKSAYDGKSISMRVTAFVTQPGNMSNSLRFDCLETSLDLLLLLWNDLNSICRKLCKEKVVVFWEATANKEGTKVVILQLKLSKYLYKEVMADIIAQKGCLSRDVMVWSRTVQRWDAMDRDGIDRGFVYCRDASHNEIKQKFPCKEEVVSSGWFFVSAVPGQMTYLVASLTPDNASILLLVVIIVTVVIVAVILVVVVVGGVSFIIKLSFVIIGVPVGPMFLLGLLVPIIVAACASKAAETLSATSFLMAT